MWRSCGPQRSIFLRLRCRVSKLLLHLYAKPCSFILENYGNGINDAHTRICFAIKNDLVFGLPRLCVIQEVLLREAIVPTTVPHRECIGVLLICVSELGARQCLNVEKSIGIDVGGQRHLGLSCWRCNCHRKTQYCQEFLFSHKRFSLLNLFTRKISELLQTGGAGLRNRGLIRHQTLHDPTLTGRRLSANFCDVAITCSGGLFKYITG